MLCVCVCVCVCVYIYIYICTFAMSVTFMTGYKIIERFYTHGSVHHESNLIAVQQDATYSVYYISVGSSTCFGC